MLSSSKIPIIVLCGFLGAGKTTLLNSILSQENGVKIGVVINDFGSVNVDSMLVAKQSDDKIELQNGCICCEVGEGGLQSAIDQIAYKNSPIEAIIIEASGLAEPAELALSLATTIRTDYARYDSMVYLIDSSNFEETRRQHPDINTTLKVADLIVLNKADLVDAKALLGLQKEVAGLAPDSTIISSQNGEISADLIFGDDLARAGAHQLSLMAQDASEASQDSHHDHQDHLHSQYQTFQFESEEPLDPQKLFAYLDSKPKPIYRIKGWCYFGLKGLDQYFVLQSVGPRWKIYIDKSGKNFHPKTNLTIISLNGTDSLSQESIQNDFSSLVDHAPDDINPETMLSVLDYDEI